MEVALKFAPTQALALHLVRAIPAILLQLRRAFRSTTASLIMAAAARIAISMAPVYLIAPAIQDILRQVLLVCP